jgi:polar amino acid transport system substrate-binding protein
MATAHAHELIASPEIETIFIATRHDSHASYCLDAIKNRKHVFVEKPLALNEEDLTKIAEARAASLKKSHLRFLVGYNRRFTPTVRTMKRFFDQMTEPMMITYRINAGFLPRDHWTQDPITGGGRIIGEVCHFIDTIQFLSNGKPTQVYAQSLSVTGNRTQSDNSAITIRLDNGSVGVITYLANGDSAVPKERIEVACGGKTAILDNFKRLELFAGGSCKITESSIVEKGHRIEVEEFIASIHSGQDLIPFESLIATTRATFKILESLESGLPVLV